MPAPRKQTAQKRLHGTERADRKPRVDYASRLVEVPPAPRNLPAGARAIWRRLATAAVGIGTLTAADLPLLGLLVTTMHAEAAARATLEREGVTVKAGSGGEKKHPAAAVAEAARTQSLMMLRELGLTPRARQSIDTAPPPAAENPFLKLGRPPPRDDFDAFLAAAPGLPTGGAGVAAERSGRRRVS